MAYKLINCDWCVELDAYTKDFICDTEDDVANLPQCTTGSSAIVITSGTMYIVNTNGAWQKFGG